MNHVPHVMSPDVVLVNVDKPLFFTIIADDAIDFIYLYPAVIIFGFNQTRDAYSPHTSALRFPPNLNHIIGNLVAVCYGAVLLMQEVVQAR